MSPGRLLSARRPEAPSATRVTGLTRISNSKDNDMTRFITLLLPLSIWAACCTVIVGLPLAGIYALLKLLPARLELPSLVFDPIWAMLRALGRNPAPYDHIPVPDVAVLVPLAHVAIGICVVIFALLLLLHSLTPLKWQLQSKDPIVRVGSDTPLHTALAELTQRTDQRMPGIWMLGRDDINAWAYTAPGGRRAVLFTRGALNRLPPNQLLWVYAHELGHLAHGDGAGSGVWIAGERCLRLLDQLRVHTINLCLATIHRLPVLYVLVFPLWLISRVTLLLIRMSEKLLKAILMLLSRAWNRRAEYRADAYAVALVGAAPGIALLEHLALSGQPTLADLVGTHPSHVSRIRRLARAAQQHASA